MNALAHDPRVLAAVRRRNLLGQTWETVISDGGIVAQHVDDGIQDPTIRVSVSWHGHPLLVFDLQDYEL